MDFFERTFKFTQREFELLSYSLACRIDKLTRDIKEYDELNSICRSVSSEELNDFHLREVAALRFELRDMNALHDRLFKVSKGGAADEK